MFKDLSYVLDRLEWMRLRRIWPNGQRYLWTDAFGVVLLVSLYHEMDEARFLDEAESVVEDVERVLGRERGLRIGEAPDRGGQYFHYLAMWIYALTQLGETRPGYRERAITLVRQIHRPFVEPRRGVWWKMEEDLSGPFTGYGLGALDAFHGYVVYRLLAPEALAAEIEEMEMLVEQQYLTLEIQQDLGLGMMLWMTHFFPDSSWAVVQRQRALAMLDTMWVDPPGYFCRHPGAPELKFAFANYGAGLGLQAVGMYPERVRRLHMFFRSYRAEDAYNVDAITHIMGCTSHFPGVFLNSFPTLSSS